MELAEVSECLAIMKVEGNASGHIACVELPAGDGARFTGQLTGADHTAVAAFRSENWVQLLRAMVAHLSAPGAPELGDTD